MLLMEKLSLHGMISELVQEPPLITIEVYDDDALVSRAMDSLGMFIYKRLPFQEGLEIHWIHSYGIIACEKIRRNAS